jgi:hypothetical protein
MHTRDEIIGLFAEFLYDNDLTSSDLLIVIELGARELAARETAHVDSVRKIMEVVVEEMGL